MSRNDYYQGGGGGGGYPQQGYHSQGGYPQQPQPVCVSAFLRIFPYPTVSTMKWLFLTCADIVRIGLWTPSGPVLPSAGAAAHAVPAAAGSSAASPGWRRWQGLSGCLPGCTLLLLRRRGGMRVLRRVLRVRRRLLLERTGDADWRDGPAVMAEVEGAG